MNVITSNDNYLVKELRKLQKKSSHRKEKGFYIVEGERSVFDTDISHIEKICVSALYAKENKEILLKYERYISVLSDKIFSSISDTKTPQGILAIVKKPKINIGDKIKAAKFILILDNVSDPGNMGTIIRTAEAAGIDLILTLGGCDAYSPKVVRASMSSIGRVNIVDIDIKAIDTLKKAGFTLVGAELSGYNFREFNVQEKIALIVGNEANGIKEEISNLLDEKVSIEMQGSIESLNVSVATAVLLYDFKDKIK